MSAPLIHGIRTRPQAEVLGDLGTALLQIKNARGLTLNDMAYALGRSDDQVAKYISGDAEMGVIVWFRANEAFPELAERIEETAADRALRARQRALDLELPVKREKAA
jgi:transcriptional regulator with XRE-family HTH domain